MLFNDRPHHALFLVRDTSNTVTVHDSMRAFRSAVTPHKFADDYTMARILQAGGLFTIATYTTSEQAVAAFDLFSRTTPSRHPYLYIRDAHPNDIMPLIKKIEEIRGPILMLDLYECYAEEFRHLLPEGL